MARSIEFVQGTGVEVENREEAVEVISSLLEEDDSDNGISIVRLSITRNENESYTVACNMRYTGYTEDEPAAVQKKQFEDRLRNIHPSIEDGLDEEAADRMVVR